MDADEPRPLSLGELGARLRERDIDFSPSQLKRLRREGLLPGGGQAHERGLRGSVSRYPSWAVEHLALVAKLARIERRFDQRRILVAWHEGWVEPAMLRDSLCRVLDGVSEKTREVAAGQGDELEATERLAKAMIDAPGRSPISGLMRTRLGGKNLDMLAFGLAAVLLGVPEQISWENHDPNSQEPALISVLDRAFGLDRAREDQVMGHPSILSPHTSTESLLGEITAMGAMDARDLGRPVREADDARLAEGFADARTVVSLGLLAEAAQAIGGHDVGGMASLTTIIEGDRDALGIAVQVRQAIVIAPHVPAGRFKAIAESMRQAAPTFESLMASNACP